MRARRLTLALGAAAALVVFAFSAVPGATAAAKGNGQPTQAGQRATGYVVHMWAANGWSEDVPADHAMSQDELVSFTASHVAAERAAAASPGAAASGGPMAPLGGWSECEDSVGIFLGFNTADTSVSIVCTADIEQIWGTVYLIDDDGAVLDTDYGQTYSHLINIGPASHAYVCWSHMYVGYLAANAISTVNGGHFWQDYSPWAGPVTC